MATANVANGAITIDKLAANAKGAGSVGLDKVNNTSDENKPVSTAQQAALDAKEPKLPTGGNTNNFLRGDRTWLTLTPAIILNNTANVTGNLNSVTAPGIYSYSGASSLPVGATATGSLLVTTTGGSNRAQQLTDGSGNVWVRALITASWTAWQSLTLHTVPLFMGKSLPQTHAAVSAERCRYVGYVERAITNSNGELTVSRAGWYRVNATSTGAWRQNASGTGRGIQLQLNGTVIDESGTDTPIVWGNNVGAWAVALVAAVNCAAGDKLEVRFTHNCNATISGTHSIEVSGI